METNDYLSIVRRRWKIVVVACLLGLVVGWFVAPDRPSGGGPEARSFTATHILAVDQVQTAAKASDASSSPTLTALSAQLKYGEVATRATSALGSDESPAALAARVNPTVDDELSTISISVTDEDGPRAATIANAFGQQFVALMNERAQAGHDAEVQLADKRLESLRAQIQDLTARIGDQRNEILSAERDALARRYGTVFETRQRLADTPNPTAGITTLQQAIPVVAAGPPGTRAPIGRPAGAGIGGGVGLLLGAAVALLAERLDTRIRTRRGAEEAFGMPVIGEIPRSGHRGPSPEVVTAARNGSPIAESYRLLRAALMFGQSPLVAPGNGEVGDRAAPDGQPAPSSEDWPGRTMIAGAVRAPVQGAAPEPRVILVTSPAPGEGKTTLVANLAAVLVEGGSSVLVLDFDFRAPGVHQCFQVPGRPGLSEVLRADGAGPGLDDVVKSSSIGHVSLVPSGGPDRNPSELFGAGRELVTAARQRADVVLLDTPPVLPTSDASELVPAVDAVVVVARAGATKAGEAARASEWLARIDAPVLGVVLVEAPLSRTARRYYGPEDRPRHRRGGRLRRRRDKEKSTSTSTSKSKSRSRSKDKNKNKDKKAGSLTAPQRGG